MLPKQSLFWKHLEALLFSLIFLFSVKAVQDSENSQLSNASKCFQLAKIVQIGAIGFLVSGTMSRTRKILVGHKTPK
jgi:hypothetical protein